MHKRGPKAERQATEPGNRGKAVQAGCRACASQPATAKTVLPRSLFGGKQDVRVRGSERAKQRWQHLDLLPMPAQL